MSPSCLASIASAAEVPSDPPHDRGHDPWMYAVGGTAGAHVGAGVTAAAKGGWDGDAVWGGILGAGLGAATVGVLKPSAGYDRDQVALTATGSAVGAWTGHLLGSALIAPGAEDEKTRIALAGVLGNVTGTGAALALSRRPPAASTLLRADLAALLGWQAAAGAMDLAQLDIVEDRQVRSPVSLAAGLGTGALALGLSGVEAPAPSADLLAISLAHGAWVGVWTPFLFTDAPDGRQIGGGLRLGRGAGYLAAIAVAPILKPDTRSTSVQVAGLLGGNALGAGLPLALGYGLASDPRAVVLPMLLGSVGGQAYGALLSRSYDLDADHAVVGSTLALWTAWQSIGWGFYGARAIGEGGEQAAGYALTAAGAGTLGALALTPVLDVTAPGAALAASGGAWGSWYGGWGGAVAGLEPEAHWLLTLGLGNAALLATGAAVAGRDPSWGAVGLVDGFGAAGGAGGALVGVIASPDPQVIGLASLAGSSAGLALGVWQAKQLGPAEGSVSLPRGLRWVPMVRVEPWTDTEGEQGVWVGVKG